MTTKQELFTHPVSEKRKKNKLPKNPQDGTQLSSVVSTGRFPSWLHRKLPTGGGLSTTSKVITKNRLATVCEEAKCPNLLECWSKKTATFLIMGKSCTRSCGFCDIDFSKNPLPLELDEPKRVKDSVISLGLKHVVITMVARDDLEDQGASHLVEVIKELQTIHPPPKIEILTSDFNGNLRSLDKILDVKPDIFNHNVETVERLTKSVRHKATYQRSLMILEHAASSKKTSLTKSGIMVGLGELEKDVFQTIRDLKGVGTDIITIGQYLQPNRKKITVKSFIHPDTFKKYEEYGLSIGMKKMFCGPFVRSSYMAENVFDEEIKI